MSHRVKRVAFIVDSFPETTETFIINQIADLQDRGITVDIYAFARGLLENISERFHAYRMAERTQYLAVPRSIPARIMLAVPKAIRLLALSPVTFFRVFDPRRGTDALSLKLLFRCEPFAGKKYDIIHCHYGKIANKYLAMRRILGHEQRFLVSLYGYDVSQVFRTKPRGYYDKLKREASAFIVMSNNMKERVVMWGFPADKMHVIPVSIDVESYPFAERKYGSDRPVRFYSVGRFVEKKGFDDLLRASAFVREKTKKKFTVNIVGGGPLEQELKALAAKLKLDGIVRFLGYKKIEDIIQDFLAADVYVQPSKTARDGDME